MITHEIERRTFKVLTDRGPDSAARMAQYRYRKHLGLEPNGGSGHPKQNGRRRGFRTMKIAERRPGHYDIEIALVEVKHEIPALVDEARAAGEILRRTGQEAAATALEEAAAAAEKALDR